MTDGSSTGSETSTRSSSLLHRDRSCLLIVDVQEKLLPVINNHERVLESIGFLLDCASVMRIPVVMSEQYPKGLGPSVRSVAEHRAVTHVFEKLRFSAAEGFVQQPIVDLKLRPQVVVAGIETHICVLQTALDLLASGYQVFVVEDATGSRSSTDSASALVRIRSAGGTMCTAESVAFEWCEVAGSDEFRTISRLVRDRDAGRR
ncbi:MAG: isochorismatase family protein [Planctomycetaceae bacterium]